jgi:hypothetical protein
MSTVSKRSAAVMLIPVPPAEAVFDQADVLYALEWAAVAPGLGGWTVLLDDDSETRVVSVIPPGMERPGFAVTRKGREVSLTWLRAANSGQPDIEVARPTSLREAMLLLCPLSYERIEGINEAMEALYPRSLRIH